MKELQPDARLTMAPPPPAVALPPLRRMACNPYFMPHAYLRRQSCLLYSIDCQSLQLHAG